MHQIDNSTAVAAMPALAAEGTPGWFTPGNPGAGQEATVFDADFANMIQAEFLAILAAGSVTADKTKLNQLATAIAAMMSAKVSAPLVAVGSITLDSTYIGKLVTDNAAGMTVTLPPANSVMAGSAIRFIQQQGGVFTQLPNGADTLMVVDEWNGTSHALTALGQSVLMISDGVSKWYVVSTATPSDVGKVCYFATSFPLAGWLVCDGSAISRTTYAKLFSRISTTFGAGDGATTFNLPDLRGEFIRGYDNGRGVDSGRGFGTSQADQLASHSHLWGVNDQGQTAGNGSPGWGGPDGTGSTSAVGGNETRPRNVALLACIKY